MAAASEVNRDCPAALPRSFMQDGDCVNVISMANLLAVRSVLRGTGAGGDDGNAQSNAAHLTAPATETAELRARLAVAEAERAVRNCSGVKMGLFVLFCAICYLTHRTPVAASATRLISTGES